MTFTLLNAREFPAINVLARREIMQSANRHRDQMDFMNSNQRDALEREILGRFDVVVGVVEHSRGVVSFHTIKGRPIATTPPSMVAGIPFVSDEIVETTAKRYGNGAKEVK